MARQTGQCRQPHDPPTGQRGCGELQAYRQGHEQAAEYLGAAGQDRQYLELGWMKQEQQDRRRGNQPCFATQKPADKRTHRGRAAGKPQNSGQLIAERIQAPNPIVERDGQVQDRPVKLPLVSSVHQTFGESSCQIRPGLDAACGKDGKGVPAQELVFLGLEQKCGRAGQDYQREDQRVFELTDGEDPTLGKTIRPALKRPYDTEQRRLDPPPDLGVERTWERLSGALYRFNSETPERPAEPGTAGIAALTRNGTGLQSADGRSSAPRRGLAGRIGSGSRPWNRPWRKIL